MMKTKEQINMAKAESNFLLTNTIGNAATKLIQYLQANIDKSLNEKEKVNRILVAESTFKNLSIIASFFSKIVECGDPEELIFIDQSGDKHDLISQKELSEEELINIFLDNSKK